MQIAFYKAFQPRATLLDKVIAVASIGKYSHVELVFSDESFSISPRDAGARFKKIDFGPEQWDLIDLTVDLEYEKKLKKEATKYLGYKYDYLGAVFSITPWCIQKNSRLFCSEVVTNIIKEVPLYSGLRDGCKYSPSALYKAIRKIERNYVRI